MDTQIKKEQPQGQPWLHNFTFFYALSLRRVQKKLRYSKFHPVYRHPNKDRRSVKNYVSYFCLQNQSEDCSELYENSVSKNYWEVKKNLMRTAKTSDNWTQLQDLEAS